MSVSWITILLTWIITIIGAYLPVSEEFSISFLVLIVVLTGIPHGAIDHVIVEGKERSRYPFFIKVYVMAAFLIIITWFIASYLALLLFIGISAYHFGQSQLSYFSTSLPKWQRGLLYLSWGSFVLLMLFNIHWVYASEIMTGVIPETIIGSVTAQTAVSALAHLSGGIFLFIMLLALFDRNISPGHFITEVTGLVSLVFLFRTVDFYLSFGLFFGVWHATRVMMTEYTYLKKIFRSISIRRFIRMLVPFSLISFAGIILIISVKVLFSLQFSVIMMGLILISALTLPHAISMEYMYDVLNYNKKPRIR